MMEEEQQSQEPIQHFENIDFNTTPDANDRENSNNEDQEEVNLCISSSFFGVSIVFSDEFWV